MPLDSTQELTTTSPTSVVDLRFYAGPLWSSLDPADYVFRALPTGWADADTPTAVWTEITDRVKWDGTLTLERDGSAVVGSMSIQGVNYDSDYLGLDRAIVVLDRVSVNGAVLYDWGLYFRGIITAGEHADDYRHGGDWQRELEGLQVPLRLTNAPRVTAGPIDIAYGKSVTETSTLADPASESGSGEFRGVTVSLAPSNVTDANLNTVWISATAPSPTGETPVEAPWIGIDKVFFMPATGYTGFWWFEVYNANPLGATAGGMFAFRNQDNVWLDLYIHPNNPVAGFESEGYGLGPKERGIVCSDRALFEALTGGARKAKWIVEAKSWPLKGKGEPRITPLDGTAFTLSPTAGSVVMHNNATFGVCDSVAWNQDGANPGIANWVGGAVDVSALTVGQGIRRSPSGTETNTAADWAVDEYPEPGDTIQPGQVEALLLDLGAHGTQLAEDYTAGGTTLTLSDTSAFPVRPGGATNEGMIGLETFTYTGRTTTTLTGVSPLAGNYNTGEGVYPYVDGAMMTGWPVSEITLVRRQGLDDSGVALPVLDTFRVYIRKTGDDTPDLPTADNPAETAWRADWDTHYFAGKGNTQPIVTFRPMGANSQGFRWMRWVMVYVMKMSDGGRAKLNEVNVMLAQTEVGGSGLGDIDGATSGALAKYLLETHYNLADGGFVDETVPTVHGLLGSHATAIAPYAAVLEDLARVTGCVARYNRAGGLNWRLDPWWPTGAGTLHLTPTATLGSEHVRGEVRYRSQKPSIVGVVVRARSVDGLSQYTAVWPLEADTLGPVREYTDYVVSSEADAMWLAQALYCREGLNYAITGAPQEAFLTIKGIGEWCGVDQWIDLATDDATGEVKPVNCAYLLRDQFTTDRSAGAVNATAAEPGPGSRTVTDTESKLTIASAALTFAGGKASPVNGDPGILYPSMARTAGRVLTAKVNYTGSVGRSFIGWSASGTAGNFLWFGVSGQPLARDGLLATDVSIAGALSASTEYKIAVVLRSAGACYFIRGGAFTEWTLLWVGGVYSAATLRPAILNYDAAFTADDVEIPDALYLPTPVAYDSFTRGNGAIGSSEATGPDGQTTVARAWTGAGATVAGNVAVITPTEGPEKLTDGALENWTSATNLTSWTEGVAGTSTVNQETSVVHGGSGALRLDIDASNSVANAYQSWTAAAGDWYLISAWLRASASGKQMRIDYGSGPQQSGARRDPGTTWTQYYQSFRSANTTGRVTLNRSAAASASLYFDDISVKKLTLATLFATHDSPTPDVMVGAKLAAYAEGTQAGIVARLDSATGPANFIIAYQDFQVATGYVKVVECVAGVYTELGSFASAYASGDRLVLWLKGSAFRAYKVNAAGVPVLLGSGTTAVLSGTLHGLFSTHSGNTFDNYSCWPVGTAGEYAALNDVGKLGYTGASSWLTERVTQEFRTADRQRQWSTRLNLRRFIR